MKHFPTLSTFLPFLFLACCAPNRTPFSPDGPPTVGMPAELSDRERQFIPEIDSALRREGMVPVANGRGDMQLEFKIAEGPINTDTDIALMEGDQPIASGRARAAGVPMVGRASVAEKSFSSAFSDFGSELSRLASRRGWSSSASSFGTTPSPPFDDQLPVY